MIRIPRFPCVVAIAIGACALCGRLVRADEPAGNGAAAYIEGIESLERADYARAVQALTRAIDADGKNGSYRRARGVANTLSESFADAITDLERARRLDASDTEAGLWVAAAYRMSGDPAKGAANFTMRDLPHDYADMVYNVMAMEYWQSRYKGTYFDRAAKRQVQVNGPVKRLFPDAARAYAQRHRATGAAAAEVIAAQMKEAVHRGDWALALRDLVQLRADAPDDTALRGYWALALVGAGNALKAREEFTRTLCITPLWAEGYLGRAQAHMILGDEPRMRADLEVAASLGAGRVGELRERFSRFAAPTPGADALQRFEGAVQADAEFAELVEDALAVHRWANVQRLRYDESYQLRIRVLSEGMRDRPHNADDPEMLGRFLFNNFRVPLVWNGPRAPAQQVRPQSQLERDNELKRAIELCDAALKIDEKHANAMATKGWILYSIKAAGPEALADRGLSIDADNVRLLNLKARVVQDHAAELEGRASILRAGRTETHTENRSDGVYEVRTHYPPTAEQLAEAAALEAQASKLRDEAGALQGHVKQVVEELIPALLKQGRDARATGDLAGVRRAFTAAYDHHPDLQETLVQLADLSKRQGDARQQQIYTLLAQPLEQTTAAGELKATWEACVHTDWKTAAETAARAAAIDPSDARAAAYRSVIEANRDDPDPVAARRWRTAALALEEARARLMGTTLLAGKLPSLELIDLQESGLALVLRLQAGNAALAAGQSTRAIAEFTQNVAIEKRLDAQLRVQLVPTAMLPDPTADANSVPRAPTLASVLGESRLGLAKAYLDLRRPAEAQVQYTALRAYLANWPATAPERETMNVVDSWARLGQAEAAYAARDYRAALSIVEGTEGWPWGLPESLEKRRKELASLVRGELNGRAERDVRQQMNLSPAQARVQAMQQEIASLQQQRDTIAADLADANLSARERQVRQGGVADLDRLIAQRKAALARLQRGPDENPRGRRLEAP